MKTYKLMIISAPGVHLASFAGLMNEAGLSLHIVSSAKPELPFDFGFTKVAFSLKDPRHYGASLKAMRKAHREFAPDVVHVHQLNSVAFFAIKALHKLGSPIVATAWGSDVLVQPQRSFLHRSLMRYSLKRAGAFTSDSAHMARVMQQYLPEKKLDVVVCNFGVKPEPVDLPKEDIIYSNRLHNPLYRIDKVIDAFERFSSSGEGTGWELVIAATGSESEKLRARAEATGVAERIRFLGWLPAAENRAWYARSKVWVSVPESDATAISLLEAMYYGCFPVLSDLPVSPEWVDHGRNGRIVKDLDSNFLEGVSAVDFNAVGRINQAIVQERGTHEAAIKAFTGLHLRLMEQESSNHPPKNQ